MKNTVKAHTLETKQLVTPGEARVVHKWRWNQSVLSWPRAWPHDRHWEERHRQDGRGRRGGRGPEATFLNSTHQVPNVIKSGSRYNQYEGKPKTVRTADRGVSGRQVGRGAWRAQLSRISSADGRT